MTRLVYLLASLVAFLGTAAHAAADGVRAAVVVEGDPSSSARAAALRIEAALRASGEIELPADEATRLALQGEAGADDGLDPVRALRRRLGWSSDDREAFTALAQPLGLTALVLVRGGEPALARVYDVGEARFFEGAASIDGDSDGSAFVLARLRAAERRRLERAAASPEQAAEGVHDATAPPTEGADEAAEGRVEASTSATDEPAERPTWIRRNWPFLVAGSLLVGATTFFVVRRDSPDDSPPVIHIRPAALRW